jgi:hypothetical protein
MNCSSNRVGFRESKAFAVRVRLRATCVFGKGVLALESWECQRSFNMVSHCSIGKRYRRRGWNSLHGLELE